MLVPASLRWARATPALMVDPCRYRVYDTSLHLREALLHGLSARPADGCRSTVHRLAASGGRDHAEQLQPHWGRGES
jgi:hypothetical protein